MDTKCRAINKQGNPCSALHYKDGWCRWHHPDLEATRRAERSKGGINSSSAARARKHLEILGWDDIDAALCKTLMDVLTGKIEPNVANSAATVARAIHVVRTATDIEQRLSELEAALTRRMA